MLPGGVKLTALMIDCPFALIGINTDESLKELQKVVKENGITWRNTWVDPKSKTGLPKVWNVRGYPTAVLIDHKGVIRKRFLGVDEEEFERDIEALVVEAEADLKKM